MPLLPKSKEEILTTNAYSYNPHRMMYFNKITKKIFSYEIIADNSDQWLLTSIKEPNNETPWQFYFNSPTPSESLKAEIIHELTS